jgi:mannosyltransferase OCH1-like enzyme
LSELLISDSQVYLVKSGNVGAYFTNSFMASKPRCKFWLEVIEEMKKPLPYYVLGKHFGVMMSTGPLMLTRVAQKTSTVIGILPAKYIMPCNICNLKCSTCESFLRPLEGSSWTNWETTFLNFWMCNWKTVVAFLICLLFLLLLAWIVRKTGLSAISLDPRNFFQNKIE